MAEVRYAHCVQPSRDKIMLLGKSIREGMGQATNREASETLDLVITNALIIDWSGIYKVSLAGRMLPCNAHK